MKTLAVLGLIACGVGIVSTLCMAHYYQEQKYLAKKYYKEKEMFAKLYRQANTKLIHYQDSVCKRCMCR